jgi:3'-5' exonuclease/Ankyrin repeats (3 copies)
MTLMIIEDSYSQQPRASDARLRKVAGGKCFKTFLHVVQGWTAVEIDNLATHTCKNPVHMAAWKGSIQNLMYLVEDLGCNIDVISTAKFSYGKTPIFFALTQSRADVVDYLLQKGANVKVINNKGQSPLSIASSHLDEFMVQKVAEAEHLQDMTEWCNYRATNSDGFSYGDQDPRFFEASLLETDIVTPYAINPTTTKSRRGNFQRHNPANFNLPEPNKPTKKKTRPRMPEETINLSLEDRVELDYAWNKLEVGFVDGAPEVFYLVTIVKLNTKMKRSWISETVSKLQQLDVNNQFAQILSKSVVMETMTALECKLFQRLKSYFTDPPNYQQKPKSAIQKYCTSPCPTSFLTNENWAEAYNIVKKLRITHLVNGGAHLSLKIPPIWVDDIKKISELQIATQSVPLLAMDAEWHDDITVSILQVAVKDKSWIIDLLSHDDTFLNFCRSFVISMFQSKIILGFAIGNDLQRLEAFCHQSLTHNATILDLQLLWKGANMPGLSHCVNEFSSSSLCKLHQCSNWSCRPLTDAQLEYAGLDAVVLPFLLSEKFRYMHGIDGNLTISIC